jgi:hypothetical protein
MVSQTNHSMKEAATRPWPHPDRPDSGLCRIRRFWRLQSAYGFAFARDSI